MYADDSPAYGSVISDLNWNLPVNFDPFIVPTDPQGDFWNRTSVLAAG